MVNTVLDLGVFIDVFPVNTVMVFSVSYCIYGKYSTGFGCIYQSISSKYSDDIPCILITVFMD